MCRIVLFIYILDSFVWHSNLHCCTDLTGTPYDDATVTNGLNRLFIFHVDTLHVYIKSLRSSLLEVAITLSHKCLREISWGIVSIAARRANHEQVRLQDRV